MASILDSTALKYVRILLKYWLLVSPPEFLIHEIDLLYISNLQTLEQLATLQQNGKCRDILLDVGSKGGNGSELCSTGCQAGGMPSYTSGPRTKCRCVSFHSSPRRGGPKPKPLLYERPDPLKVTLCDFLSKQIRWKKVLCWICDFSPCFHQSVSGEFKKC